MGRVMSGRYDEILLMALMTWRSSKLNLVLVAVGGARGCLLVFHISLLSFFSALGCCCVLCVYIINLKIS